MGQYILAIDQGTTSTRSILFDAHMNIINTKQSELKLFYPDKGWVEQDPEVIWDDTLQSLQAIKKEQPDLIEQTVALGITNQRETTIIWDRKTGEPIYNAIVWQDRRTSAYCDALKSEGHENSISDKTGLLLDPYFSATKIKWILDNVDGAHARAEAGELAFGTVDCFLIWKLTGGKIHATDITNASRTMLYNIQALEWDQELLSLFGIPASLLPEVKENVDDFGALDETHLGKAIPIGGVAGDQQAALIGQGCFQEGMVKSTYGTGCFALMHVGPKFKPSKNRLLTTLAYKIKGELAYALEGSIFVAGSAIQWLRDGLGLFDHAAKSEEMANSVSDNNSVYFVPALTGLGAPYWQPEARGMIYGIGRETTKEHIARAALEAQAYQTYDLMQAMQADSGLKTSTIRADGGLMANGWMCQFLADMLGAQIDIPKIHETTALGAAYLAALSAGIYPSLDDISQKWSREKNYQPSMDEKNRQALLSGWADAVERVRLNN